MFLSVYRPIVSRQTMCYFQLYFEQDGTCYKQYCDLNICTFKLHTVKLFFRINMWRFFPTSSSWKERERGREGERERERERQTDADSLKRCCSKAAGKSCKLGTTTGRWHQNCHIRNLWMDVLRQTRYVACLSIDLCLITMAAVEHIGMPQLELTKADAVVVVEC